MSVARSINIGPEERQALDTIREYLKRTVPSSVWESDSHVIRCALRIAAEHLSSGRSLTARLEDQ